jgi:hypothetical protein
VCQVKHCTLIINKICYNSVTKLTIAAGGMVLIWFFIWWKVVKSGPEEDPHISSAELKYIQDSLGNSTHKVIADIGNLLHISSSSFHYADDWMKLVCHVKGMEET